MGPTNNAPPSASGPTGDTPPPLPDLPSGNPATHGLLAGHTASRSAPHDNNLSEGSEPAALLPRESVAIASRKTTVSATNGTEHNNRNLLRDIIFCPPVNQVHFDRFCSGVERIYGPIGNVKEADIAQFIQANFETLTEIHDFSAQEHPPPEPTAGAPVKYWVPRKLIERLALDYPNLDSTQLRLMAFTLNKDCQILRGCSLESLEPPLFRKFTEERIEARAELASSAARKLLRKESLNRTEFINLFSPAFYDTDREIAYQNEDLQNTTSRPPARLYRLGTFCLNEDEMGRMQNYKLGKPAFQRGEVNHQRAAFGLGLYTADSISSCLVYRTQWYNQDKPITVLEITPDRDSRVFRASDALMAFIKTIPNLFSSVPLSFNENSNNDSDSDIDKNRAIERGRCFIPKSMLKTETGYFVIKDPDCIKSIRAFHPDMTTKIHVPFTKEQVLENWLEQKNVAAGKLPPARCKNIGQREICDVLEMESGRRNVYKSQFPIRPDRRPARTTGIKRLHEDKYYILNATKEYFIRVKPKAPVNQQTTEPGSLFQIIRSAVSYMSGDAEPAEFHVQYHRPKGGSTEHTSQPLAQGATANSE